MHGSAALDRGHAAFFRRHRAGALLVPVEKAQRDFLGLGSDEVRNGAAVEIPLLVAETQCDTVRLVVRERAALVDLAAARTEHAVEAEGNFLLEIEEPDAGHQREPVVERHRAERSEAKDITELRSRLGWVDPGGDPDAVSRSVLVFPY